MTLYNIIFTLIIIISLFFTGRKYKYTGYYILYAVSTIFIIKAVFCPDKSDITIFCIITTLFTNILFKFINLKEKFLRNSELLDRVLELDIKLGEHIRNFKNLGMDMTTGLHLAFNRDTCKSLNKFLDNNPDKEKANVTITLSGEQVKELIEDLE